MKTANLKISLVIPVYNEQVELAEVLAKYIKDLKQICSEVTADKVAKTVLSYELVVVNDGSKDKTARLLAESARLNRNIRVINFDARYGKQAAVTAGMDAAAGDCVVLADVDVLNPVGILKRVIEEYLDGEDIVFAYRERSGWDRFQNGCSEGFVSFATKIYGIEGKYVGRPRVVLFSRSVTDVIVSMPAKNKLLRTMDNWVGFNIKSLVYASGYNKQEEKVKERESKEQFKQRGGDIVQRSKIREHTSALIWANALALVTVFVFAAAIILLAAADLSFIFHFFAWMVGVLMSFVTVVAYARAVLIKRVGIIHSNETTEIYNIKNRIN